jgi:Winged helix DNA-binding domain
VAPARPIPVLSRRALNRAALHRQLLLRRDRRGVVEGIETIGGLNAQQVNDPYFALHSRLANFTMYDLTTAIEDGRVVRSCLLRATQHLVSAADFRWLRPVVAPVLARAWRGVWRRRVDGVDIDLLVADARAILDGHTMTRPELGGRLAETRPGTEATALSWTVQYLLPQVHPAPSGTWDNTGVVPVALAEDGLDAVPDPRRLVRRYLASYGPATTADIRTWSGVTGLREVVAGMRGQLRTFRDESGRELYDLPDAPRPDPDTPAPVRLLAGFDNLLLAHADRTRIMSDEIRHRVCVGDLIEQTVLIDGNVAGTWRLDRAAGVLTIHPFARLPRADADAAITEGLRLLRFAAGTASDDVRVLPPS